MKNLFPFLTSILFLISCNSPSDLQKDFSCENISSYNNLKEHTGVRNLFSIKLPKHWKTNLYYDNSQSSIYSADTTKSLTKSTLIDATVVHESVNFNKEFQQKIASQNIKEQLINSKSKTLEFLKRPSFFNLAKGKKGKYNYQILDLFIKTNQDNFMHIKTEVYGDSLVNERFCKAIKLIELMEINQ